jgi:signal transduction histidine kinase
MNRFARPTARGWRLIAACVALCSTMAVGLVPPADLVFDLPALHAALDTTGLLVSAIVTFLLGGRYMRTGRLDDLLLTAGLGVGVSANLVSTTITVANLSQVSLSPWAAVAGQIVSGIFLVVAAFCPPRVIVARRAQLLRFAGTAALGFALLLLVLSPVLPHLPTLTPEGLPKDGSPPLLTGPPAFLGVQLSMAVVFALAALGFGRRSEVEGDRFAHWLALSCILGAVGRLDYFLYPSLYTQWVSVGDLLRVARFGVLLYGAGQEVSGYWRSQSAAAVLEERRRLARDLHDGVAQELAYIGRRARRSGDDPVMVQIAAAADRALLDSRRAIAALSLPIDERFDIVLGRIAEETAARAGAQVDLHLDVADVERDHAEALIRIVSEAVLNATRHGGAERVRVELESGDGLYLRVIDDGGGFDPAAAASRPAPGFGLVSMRERAEAIGGLFTVSSRPGTGTVVEVRLP